MTNCIVFGASNGGKNFITQQKEHHILFVVDNDKKKHGGYIEGKKIYPIEKILECEYDYIIIASMFYKSITKQLLELGIIKEKIKCAPKTLMKKEVYPFADPKTIDYSWKVLNSFVNQFNDNNVQYVLEYGTLLGFYRNSDFIPWDDDIDFSIVDEENKLDVKILTDYMINILNSIDSKVRWKYSLLYNKEDEFIGIDFSFLPNNEVKDFTVNVGFIKFKEGMAYQVMNYAPRKHYEKCEEFMLNNKIYKIPYDPIGYLEFTYGEDWRKEKKFTSFDTNTKTFFEPKFK